MTSEVRHLVRRLLGLFRATDAWEYGTCKGRKARRHRKSGAVQFVLWRAGEQGHAVDYWHDFAADWWPQFEPHNTKSSDSRHE